MTLLEEFVILMGDEKTTKENILEGFDLVFRDELLLRNPKDIQLEIDLKSPV